MGDSSNLEWIELEERYAKIGKDYGYTQGDLRDFVAKKVREVEERNEKVRAREEAKEHQELTTKLQKVETELQAAVSRLGKGPEMELAGSVRPPQLGIPKYPEKQDVRRYLTTFEEVVKQNGFAPNAWLLALKSAVLGTKLEEIIEATETYEEAKQEILRSYGRTADKAWADLCKLKQDKEETFHRFVMRITLLVAEWTSLAGVEESERNGAVPMALCKQFLLNSVTPDLKAFLLENKVSAKGPEEIVDLGTLYQEAHGVPKEEKKLVPAVSQELQASAQCFQVTVESLERQLKSMTLDERRQYVREHNLCFRCLQVGHINRQCSSTVTCAKCSRKHHTLLHQDNWPQVKVTCVRDRCRDVMLMTAVAKATGKKWSRIRVFIDPGAQSSFVSPELVEALELKHVEARKMLVKAFGGEAQPETFQAYELTLEGLDGQSYRMEVLEQADFDMDIAHPTAKCQKRWADRGMALSDVPGEMVSGKVHLLIGADYCNQFLVEKVEEDDEYAWKSVFGWLVSGPVKEMPASTSMQVASVQTDLDCLWKLEEPLVNAEALPVFPLTKQEERYEVGLLWKSEERPKNNHSQALAAAHQQLRSLEAKGKRPQYDEVLLDEYQALGAVESEPNPSGPGYYLPHHAVIKESAETTKVRVVFNASAAAKGGKSLNEVIDPGPSLLPDLTGMLLRFRELPVGLQADIKKAFFMISVQEEDRCYLRFLWPDENGSMATWRLKRLPFGVNCSPFILNAVIQVHLKSVRERVTPEEQAVVDTLLQCFYVDDCISSVESAEEARAFQKVSCEALGEAGMELRKWRFSGEGNAPAATKVLGVQWCTATDCLSIGFAESLQMPKVWTRRNLLQCVATAFDSLGLVAPVLVTGKMLLQDAWKENGSWDDPLSQELAMQVSAWWGEIGTMSEVAIPRWLQCERTSPVTLHVFCDASEKAYACTIYLVAAPSSCLLFAKSKVAPIKQISLARLELQGCMLASQVLEFVHSQLRLRVTEVHAWTDSLTALFWIQGKAYRWKTWVANRVSSIQQTAEKLKVTWHHCPGTDNPADLPSRGTPVKALKQPFWVNGPAWLPTPAEWPQLPAAQPTDDSVAETKLNAIATQSLEPDPWWEAYTSWSRVKGVMQVILAWKYRDKTKKELAVRAENTCFRLVQGQCFAKEGSRLKARQRVAEESRIARHQPYLDEDHLIRARGRLQLADLEPEAKHPIILADHHLTRLMLQYAHVSRLHQGVEGCLGFLRRRFLILAGRRMLRGVKEKCVTCRRHDAAVAVEVTAQLPQDRVVQQRPFSVVGIDHAGPLLVKNGTGVAKAWIVLFVCATTRAVHLDLVTSLSTEDFVHTLRRFVARFGTPALIRSDNGKTFVAAAKLLKVEWRFNPPASPWHGGFYERLVAVVKSPLRRVLGRAMVTPQELLTLLMEVEFIVNERPLTHVGGLDEPEPLTPNMLVGRMTGEDGLEEEALNHQRAGKRFQYLRQLRKHVESHWTEEYLLTLNSYHERNSHQLQVGDVVLVASDRKRIRWKLALVTVLYPGADGKRRVAKVRVEGKEFFRPIQRLVPLEVSAAYPEEVNGSRRASTVAEDVAPPEQPMDADPPAPDARVSRTRTRVVKPRPRLDL